MSVPSAVHNIAYLFLSSLMFINIDELINSFERDTSVASSPQTAQSGSTGAKTNVSRQLSGGKATGRSFKTPSNVSQQKSGFAVAHLPIRVKEAYGQDVKFLDVPNENFNQEDQEATNVTVSQASTTEITANDILIRCEETNYRDVYEICLHASGLTKIQHLEPFTKLRSLDLSGNQITVIENLHQNLELRELKLYDNKISQIANLERLKDLLHLHVQHNRIQSIGHGLHGLLKLKVLRLDFNRISRIEVRELASCSQLTSLDISNNCLASISAVASLPNLEELYARHNDLRKVDDLSRCKKLQEVDLSFNPLSDLSGLKDNANIRNLCVSHCQLSSFSSLGKLKDLEELNASHCQLRTMKPLAQYYPSLQILNVSWNYLISKDDLSVLNSLNELVELSVEGNPFCDDFQTREALLALVYSLLPQLQVLDSVSLIRTLSQPLPQTLPAHPLIPLTRPMTPVTRPMTPLVRPMTPRITPEAPGDSQNVMSSAQRPMTPVTSRRSATDLKVNEKQMEKQLSDIQAQLDSFETEFSVKLKSLRASINVLPNVVTSTSIQKSGSLQSSESRPLSRCGMRTRLQDAKSFAEHLRYETQ